MAPICNRLFVEAVLYRYRAGIPWRDLPERFGDFRVVHTRVSRWARAGAWQRVFETLAADADNATARVPQKTADQAISWRVNMIENFFQKLKPFRSIATRYDTLARHFLARIQLAATCILLN